MKILPVSILTLWTLPMSCLGADFVLTEAATNLAVGEWAITSEELGLSTKVPVAVRQRVLAGGKQAGVELIEIDNGALQLTIIPTRGMSLLRATSGAVTLGWDSPVEEVVNPAFIELESRGGLGWLDGFNEMLVRCGYEWTGHPGTDEGRFFSLHGRAGNTPASKVVISIEDEPPHRIRVRGLVVEKVFKFVNFELWTEVSTVPGSHAFTVRDVLTNRADYAKPYQVIYHGNFGPPLLEGGAEFVAPVKEVAPFNDYAARDMDTWTTYRGPTRAYNEQVYNVIPYAEGNGMTTVMLQNQAADLGLELTYDSTTLPYFTLWKNTDTEAEGYVTGLEPGTGYAYTRAIERAAGRLPELAPGDSVTFELRYRLLTSAREVASTHAAIMALQGGRSTQQHSTPTALE